MKYTLLSITVLLCALKGIAQPTLKPHFKDQGGGLFKDYVYVELVKRKDLLSHLCERVTGSIQLLLDKKGRIKSVSITGTMSDTLRQSLKDITLLSDGLWEPMEIRGRKVESLPIILFMSLHLGEGCKNSKEIMLKAVTSDFSNALSNSLDNDDSMHCFVLRPLTFVWDYEPGDINFQK
jgi:hypothetical protein